MLVSSVKGTPPILLAHHLSFNERSLKHFEAHRRLCQAPVKAPQATTGDIELYP